ncbi:MAG: hypothetical protein R2909_10390 [Gemmatimonadales bacterium]
MTGDERPATRYGSFVVQARTDSEAGGVRVRGVIEDLRNGNRVPFESAAELGQLIGHWGEASTLGPETTR